ncbi:ClpP/crotonase-like domain-containing protein [Baffinella frigidus]|nr:ClpP/crotonase-like domain-containing protein [Cryptophyta sp. CCMP2293]
MRGTAAALLLVVFLAATAGLVNAFVLAPPAAFGRIAGRVFNGARALRGMAGAESEYMQAALAPNGLASLCLDRPKALNAANTEMCEAMREKVRGWGEDVGAKAILLKSSSERAFCSGGDVKALAVALREDPATSLPVEALSAEYALLLALRDSPLPSVAVLDGVTMGFGLGLAWNAKVRVVTERTLVAMPECAIGLFPDVGFALLCKARPDTALYLGLTGARLGAKASPAQDLIDVGIGTHFVPSDKLGALHAALQAADLSGDADQAGDLSGDADQAIAAAVGQFASPPPTPPADAPPSLQTLAPAIHRCFGPDRTCIADITSALGAEAGPSTEWAAGAVAGMAGGAPLSKAATLAHFRAVLRGSSEAGEPLAEMGDVLAMELRLATHLKNMPDLVEGITARLIDKTNLPVWAPASDAAVTEEMVQACFAKGSEGADEHALLGVKRPRAE